MANRFDELRRGDPWASYGLAIIATALTALLRRALDPLLTDSSQYILFYFSAMLVSVIDGLEAGLLAVLLGAVTGAWLFFNLGHVGSTWTDDIARLILFLFFGGATTIMAGRLRAARNSRARALVSSIESLEQSDELFRLMVASEGDFAIFMLDPAGHIVSWNRGAQHILGYVAGEIVGQHFSRFYTREDVASHRPSRALAIARAEGQYAEEGCRVRKDGCRFWARVTMVPVYAPAGELRGFAEITRDVTDRKRAEEELASVAQFPAENPHPVLRISRGGQVLYANKAAEALLEREGWARSEPAPAILRDPAVAALAGANPREFEFVCHDQRVLALLCVPLPEKGYANLYGRDVTEARRLEAALWQSKQRLRLAQQVAHIGTFEWNIQTNVNVWTTELEALHGLPPGAFGGSYEAWTACVHPDDLAAAEQRVRESLDSDRLESEWRVVWPDGTVKWLAAWGQVFKDQAGQPLRMVGVNIDITKQKQTEEALKAARQTAEHGKAAAEQASRAKDHFLAVLSHELRTPLAPVAIAMSMLQDNQDLDPEMRETFEMIRRNVEVECRLIDDLLDVTRISHGKIELDRSPVELGTVIQRAVEVCKPDIQARGLRFSADWGPAAPYWVEADLCRLQQVFWNLLKNAIKFTPHGGCVGIRCQRDEGHVLVEVHDSGIGIEPESLPTIYDAFEQADRSITRKFGGLGLGLAITKALVDMHGGTISAHSEGRNKGATFRIRLPLSRLAGKLDVSIQPGTPPRAVRPLRILLVEDHGVTAMMVRMVLTSAGHSVETSGDVATALEVASRHAFDLLISDLGLPDGSGHDLMRELRRRGHKFPGLALTGYGQEDDIHRSHEAGFVAHLTKPASREAIIDAVASATAGDMGASQRPVP